MFKWFLFDGMLFVVLILFAGNFPVEWAKYLQNLSNAATYVLPAGFFGFISKVALKSAIVYYGQPITFMLVKLIAIIVAYFRKKKVRVAAPAKATK